MVECLLGQLYDELPKVLRTNIFHPFPKSAFQDQRSQARADLHIFRRIWMNPVSILTASSTEASQSRALRLPGQK